MQLWVWESCGRGIASSLGAAAQARVPPPAAGQGEFRQTAFLRDAAPTQSGQGQK